MNILDEASGRTNVCFAGWGAVGGPTGDRSPLPPGWEQVFLPDGNSSTVPRFFSASAL